LNKASMRADALTQVSASIPPLRSDGVMHTRSSTHHRPDDAVLPELDLRWLPSPEPMLRALAAADALLPGQAVQVLTPLLPTPLLDALASRGMQVTAFALPTGGARVLIRCLGGDDTTSS
jgi:hypothetical protein